MAKDAVDEWASRGSINSDDIRKILGEPFLKKDSAGYVRNWDDVFETFRNFDGERRKHVVRGVKALKIDHGYVTDRQLLSLVAILDRGHFHNLQELDVWDFCTRDFQVAGQKFCDLLESGRLYRLRSLAFGGDSLSDEGVEVFAKSLRNSHFSKLDVLCLQSSLADDEGGRRAVKALVDTISSGHLSNLLTLGLQCSKLGTEAVRSLTETFGSGHINKLENLDLSGNKLGDAEVELLSDTFASGHLDNLRTLGLARNRVRAKGVAFLAKSFASGRLNNLESLDLEDNLVRDAGVDCLANAFASGHLDNLRLLNLANNEIGAKGVDSLAKAFVSGRSKKLNALYLQWNNVGDAGTECLANAFASHQLDNLQMLSLSGNRVGDAGAEYLANAFASGHLSRLCVLGLSDNNIGSGGAVSLCKSFLSRRCRYLTGLETLHLANNQIGGVGMVVLEELPKSGLLSALKTVDLSHQTYAEVKRIARLTKLQNEKVVYGEHASGLSMLITMLTKGRISMTKYVMHEWASKESINLHDIREILGEPFLTKPPDDVLEAFAEICMELKPVFCGVKALKIDIGDITDLGLLALVVILKAGEFNDLHQLAISSLQVTDFQKAGQKFCNLLASGRLNNLRSLHLDCRGFGDEGMEAFAKSLQCGHSKKLEALGLKLQDTLDDEAGRRAGEAVGAEGTRSLMKSFGSGHLENLEFLDLSGNELGDAGMESLGEAFATGHLNNLRKLGLGGNRVGDRGIDLLSKTFTSGHLSELEFLGLEDNSIGDEGAEYLASTFTSGHLSSLRALDLSGNHIGKPFCLFNRLWSVYRLSSEVKDTVVNFAQKNSY